jgi:hypothetical protein
MALEQGIPLLAGKLPLTQKVVSLALHRFCSS